MTKYQPFGDPDLNRSIVVYVPTTQDVDKKLTAREMHTRVNSVVKYLTALFGGTTRIRSTGSWMSDEEKEVEEEVILVETMTTDAAIKKNIKTLKSWLKSRKKVWGQAVLSVEYEEDLHFI